MLESQKVQRSQSEKRRELHAVRKQVEGLPDDASPERRGELSGQMTQVADDLSALDLKYCTAVDAEAKAVEDARKSGDHEQPSAEVREYRDVENRATLGGFMRSVVEGQPLKPESPEAELRAATLGAVGGGYDGIVPWAMFLEKDKIAEIRTAFAPGTTIPAMQDPIIQEVFAASTAAFLGTRFESDAGG